MAFSTAALNAHLDEVAEAHEAIDAAYAAYDRGETDDRGDCDYAYRGLDLAESALAHFLAPVLASPIFVHA